MVRHAVPAIGGPSQRRPAAKGSQGMDKATVGGVVQRLEAKGLVARESDPDDGRVNRVTLTTAGRTLAAQLKPFADEVNGRATARLSSEEAKQLLSLLIRARGGLSS